MKILLAVDGSEASERAAKYVVKIAKQLAKPPGLALIHVDVPLLRDVTRKLGPVAVAEYHAGNGEYALGKAKRMLSRAKLEFEVMMVVGDPATEIAKAAKDLPADTVVMGSRGLTRLKSLLLGSVAMKVMARSALPVTLVD